MTSDCTERTTDFFDLQEAGHENVEEEFEANEYRESTSTGQHRLN